MSGVTLLLLFSLLSQPVKMPVAPAQPEPDTFDLAGRTVVLSADDGYRSIYENAYPLLKRYHMTMTLALIGNYLTKGRIAYRPGDRFINRAEVQEMIDSCGAEVASHGLSHAYLTRIDSARVWREAYGSKHLLESLFNREVITFVYPYGRTNPRVRRTIARAGYLVARAVRPGNPDLGADPYRIPEVELRDTTSLARVQHHIRHHRVTVLMLHSIVPQPQRFTEWSTGDFAALLGWLHRRNAKVVTLGGLYRTWWRQKVTKELLQVIEEASDRRQDLLFKQVDVDATGTLHPR